MNSATNHKESQFRRFSRACGLGLLTLALTLNASAQVPTQMRYNPTGSDAVMPVEQGGAVGVNSLDRSVNGPAAPGRVSAQSALLPGPEAQAVEATRAAAAMRAQPSQFQRFVKDATGQQLELFGADLFTAPNTYTPVTNISPPDSYLLGVGDEIQLQVWGGYDLSTRLTIDRNGQVQIPRVGTVSLAGVTAGQLQDVMKASLAKVYTNISVAASVSKLRSIQVYVVGQAARPGTYTLSSLSSLVNALFASGGPSSTGSMRHIELRRANKLVSTLDLYAFIAKGDKSKDLSLQPGDVIVIPPAGPRIAVTGAYDHAAIYELQGTTTIEQILALGGGVPTLAATQKAVLERVDPAATPPRQVAEIALNPIGLSTNMRDGDILTLINITQGFGNAVTLKGNVAYPLRHAWHIGMRVLDLIPEPAALVTQDYYRKLNSVVQVLNDKKGLAADLSLETNGPSGAVGPADAINWDYATIERLDPKTLLNQTIPFNLGRAVLTKDPESNLLLQPGDVVTVYSDKDMRLSSEKKTRLVRVEGEVAAPGVYPTLPGETLPQLLRRVGGLTPQAYLYGAEFTRRSVREQQQKNLEKFIARLESTYSSQLSAQTSNIADAARATTIMELQRQRMQQEIARLKSLRSSGRVALELPTEHDELGVLPPFTLEDGDTVYVPSTPSFVAAYGAVANENAIVYRPGRSVGEVLHLAGVTDDADKNQIFVLRADGTIVSRQDHTGWLGSGFESIKLMPGDTVVVPVKVDRETFWSAFLRNAKDITQILANMGLGMAAIKTL